MERGTAGCRIVCASDAGPDPDLSPALQQNYARFAVDVILLPSPPKPVAMLQQFGNESGWGGEMFLPRLSLFAMSRSSIRNLGGGCALSKTG